MKLNHFALVRGSKLNSFGRRKKERDSIRIDAAIKAVLDKLDHHARSRDAFLRLLTCMRARTPLLKPTAGRGTPGWIAPVFLIHRLGNLAMRHGHWLRPCETWHAGCKSVRPTFHSLAEHLFCYYPVPPFMDSAWDVADGPEAFRQQSWFIRLGRGASFRSLNLPLPLTRWMEHWVRRAPDHYSVMQALRYGEARGFGCDEGVAREIAGGRLGQRIDHPEFWGGVFAFFIAHPETSLEHINPIIDFIQAIKFAGDELLTATGPESRKAPSPDFSMKGRTLKSMLRLVTAWHGDLARSKHLATYCWRESGIPGYRFLEKRPGDEPHLEWTIRELLDSVALYEEGRAMHHCVFSYAEKCRKGETTIWSLTLRVDGTEKRIATVEVNPRKRLIIQARKKCNHWPRGRPAQVIREWASWAGLQVGIQL